MKKNLLFPAFIIAIAFFAGILAHSITNTVDSPVEQVAELILRDNGIDVDFSKSKKDK